MTSFRNAKHAISMLALLFVAACGTNGNNNSSNPAQVGTGPVGQGVDMTTCQVGQVYSPQYGCLNRGACQAGYGWIAGQAAGANNCIAGTVVTETMKYGAQAGSRFFGTLTITNKSQFNQMLQYTNICSPNYIGFQIGFNGINVINCDTLTSRGGFMILKSFGGASGADTINLTIGAGTQYPYDLLQTMPTPVGAYGSPLYGNNYNASYGSFSQQSRLYTYNNNNGMKIVGVGPNGVDVGLMATVDNGNLGSQHLDMQIIFQGTTVATVGLDSF